MSNLAQKIAGGLIFKETISETEFVLCPEPDLPTYTNVNCDDFEEVWLPTTVETAVTRGKKLRECKPSVQLHHEYQVGIDYVKPIPEKKRSHRLCYQRPCFNIYNSPCIPTHSPPCGCCSNSSSVRCKTYRKSQTSLSHHKQCSLRIMELATPTKRHCLDTWRSKSHILPDYMLDRIRQHVMDEKPIVQIPDALNCFKKRVSNRSSRSSKHKVSDACMSDVRRYSAIFAHCVARKLDKPLNITLNPELEKVSRIVSYEISRVTGKNSKKGHIKNKHNKFEKQMQDEMSKKVTAWIDNVLEDTSGKLLQDELRDLEEEEGPVLDIIDDLIDNVVTSCEPEDEDIKYDTAGDMTEDDSEVPDQTADDIEITPTIDGNGEGDDNNLSIEDYLTRELNKEIDKIISKREDDLTTGNLDSQLDDTQMEGTENANNVTMPDILNENINSVNENISTDSLDKLIDNTGAVIDDIDTGLENVILTIPSNKASEYVFEHVTEEESQDQEGKVDGNVERNDDGNENNSENDDETGETTNVSELYTNSEESLDDMNKTVKFSKVDDDLGRIGDFISENLKLPELENEEKDRPKKFSHDNNIVFASPNESLLSDADEPWPNDISVGGPKLSANVSKSIMSLGLIQENVDEEKQAIDEISVEVTAGDDTVIDVLQNKVNDVQGKTFNHDKETEEIRIPAHESQKLTTDPIEYFKTAVLQKSKPTDNIKKDKNKHELGSPTLIAEDMKHLKKEIIQSVHTFDNISEKEKDNDLNELGFPTLITEEMKHLKKETIQSYISDNVVLPNKKVNYKVDAKTAPLWVVSGRCDKGRGEPEDSFPKHKLKDENEINEGEARILAKNLEILSANLLIWNDWIDTTCKNIKHIKRKSERNKSRRTNTYRKKDIHYWIKLEKCVYKDAHFWLKWKHSAKKKLKTYDCIQTGTTQKRPKQHDASVHSTKCNCKMDSKKMPDNT